MRAEIDHRALEAGIAHHGHGDQQPAVEIALLGRIVANAGLLAANLAKSFALRVHPQSTLSSCYILILGDRPVNQAYDKVFAARVLTNHLALTSNSMVRTGPSL